MKSTSEIVVKSYVDMLESLPDDFKLEIISQLSSSMKSKATHKNGVKSSFGKWVGNETPAKLVSDIRKNRKFKRKTQPL